MFRALSTVRLLLLALAVSGCVPLPAKKPKAETNLFERKKGQGAITPTVLQAQVMRFADEYLMVVAQAADDFAAKAGTPEARYMATRIKLNQGTAAVVDATGQNPIVNAMDLVVLASVARMVAQDYLVDQQFKEAVMPLLDASRQLETNAWSLVGRVLRPEQQQELRELIQEWRRKNPKQRDVNAVRFREFAEAIGTSPQKFGDKPASVFSLLFLDPMAGLDPTVRAVEETRYLAERVLYYGQRMPMLVGWQAELLALQLADQPATKQLLTNANQFAASLQVFSKTAEQLPQIIDQQREAALQQVFAGIATERTNLLASLASEDEKMRDLLAEMRGTLSTAGEMANSVKAAVQSLDAFVRYVSPSTNAPAEPANTNSRPFDVLDYGTAAGQIGGMAKDLNTLLTSVNQSMPQATQLGQQTADRIERAFQHGFWLGLVLIVVLLVGAVLAGMAYRILANKLARRGQGATAREP
jgi:hypothetical protein